MEEFGDARGNNVILTEAYWQEGMARWLCQRIGLVPTPMLVCMGNVVNGRLRGVVGYDNHNGASCVVHSAGEGNWLTRDFLHVVFDYPFNHCGYNILLGFVPSGNTRAIKLNQHLGFEVLNEIAGGHPDGSLFIMGMRKEQCRFLRIEHGKKERACA